MGFTRNEIDIDLPIDEVFETTNDLENWPTLFKEYTEVKIIERQGDVFDFQLTNDEGETWRSRRVLDRSSWSCSAERIDPKYPFKYMKIEWSYSRSGKGTRMIWEQNFEMDPACGYTDEQVEVMINKHSKVNMQGIKEILEKFNEPLPSIT